MEKHDEHVKMWRKKKRKEYMTEYNKKYFSRPEIKEKQKEYYSKPKIKEKRKEYMKEYTKEYYSKPKIKEKQKEYYSKPKIKEKRKEYMKEYNKEYFSRPEIKEKQKEYYSKPKIKEKKKEYMTEYNKKYNRKKLFQELRSNPSLVQVFLFKLHNGNYAVEVKIKRTILDWKEFVVLSEAREYKSWVEKNKGDFINEYVELADSRTEAFEAHLKSCSSDKTKVLITEHGVGATDVSTTPRVF